jgi:hypothetical protein
MHVELPAIEEYPTEQLVQFVAPTTLEYVLFGQLMQFPFCQNLPGTHKTQLDDA